MRISVVHPGELGPDDIASWRLMQRSTASLANPFLSPEFAIAVGRFRPSARVAVLADGPSIVGFFPFEQRRFNAGVPIAAGLTDCQGLVHVPGAEWDARELLRACRISVWQFDHLVDGQRPFDHYRAATMPSPIIDLTGGFDTYYQKLRARSPQLCSNVARKARKLARESGDLHFEVDSRDVSALRSLMAWKSDQYHRTGQINRFAQPWIVGLIEALFTTSGTHFGGMLSVLYARDVPIAAHFGLRCGPVLAHWFPAYDTRFSRYSPGLILHLRMAEAVPKADIALIDLGTGANRYKEELKSRDIFVGKGIVTGRSLLAAAHRARWAAGPWAVRKLRQHPSFFQAAHRLRRHYREARRAVQPSPMSRRPNPG